MQQFLRFKERLDELGVECVTGTLENILDSLVADLKKFERVLLADLPQQLESVILSKTRAISLSTCTLKQIEEAEVCVAHTNEVVVEAGSLVLVSRSTRHRLATTLPERLYVICTSPKIYDTLYEYFLNRLPLEPNTTTTFISGPSRTADIEQILIKGVHGPKFVKVYFEKYN